MKAYLLKRLLLMVPTLVGITFITYAIVRLSPGDPVEAMIRAQTGNIDPAAMERRADRIRERLGLVDRDYFGDGQVDALDKFLGLFHGYGGWISRFLSGDAGESIKFFASDGSRNPWRLILDRIGVTLTLNVVAMAIVFAIAIPVGLMSAQFHGRFFDRGSTLVLLGLWSIPPILAGTVLLGFLARGGIGLEWFPVAGLHSEGYQDWSLPQRIGDLLWHITLPVVCLVYGGLAYLAKLGRASLLENLRADYVRTARAKGLPERRVVYRHALRNSLLPMITTMVMMLPAMIGGSVIVESIFSIPGTGRLFVEAAKAYDLLVIMAETLLYGFLTLGALILGDVLYAWADPRVRFD